MNGPFVNLTSALLLFGAVQAVFLALVLLRTRSGNRIANRFLAWLLIIFSLGLADGFMSASYYYLLHPYLIGLEAPLIFIYGPLIYFYVKSLTNVQRQSRGWRIWAHFIPAILVYLYLVPFFLSDPELKTRAWFVDNSHLKNFTPFIDPILIVAVIQIAGYLILSLRLLMYHSQNIKQSFSSLESINLAWMRTMVIVLFCLLSLFAFFAIFSQFYGLYKEAEYAANLAIVVMIYIMGYKGIRQPEIFSASAALSAPDAVTAKDRVTDSSDAAMVKADPDTQKDEAEKYRKSALTDEQAEMIAAQLAQLMENKKPYLEMGLTLPMLSSMLNVSPHHLSQVINEKLGTSFFDFVNSYRVQEAKRALNGPESDRFSILGIAMDAGFNSKSAFYTAFKKHSGMTPSQFKQRSILRNQLQV